jgi:hypothetical protein
MKHKKTRTHRKSTVECDVNCTSHHQFFSFERALQTIEVMLVDM